MTRLIFTPKSKKTNLVNLLAYGFIVAIVLLIYWVDAGYLTEVIQRIKVIPYYDKYCHFILFGLAALAANVVTNYRSFSIKRVRLFWGSSLLCVLVLAEEISQMYLPNRTFDWFDLMADAFGIAVFSYVSWKISLKKSTQKISTAL